MLGKGIGNVNNLAWLRDESSSRALQIARWSAAPEASGLCFFAPDFALKSQTPWLIGEETEFPQPHTRPLPRLTDRLEPSPVDFSRVHEGILGALSRHEFSKVVPIVAEELEFLFPLKAGMFPAAFKLHPHQYSYGFEWEGEGLAGVTPELLFRVRDGELTTMALAGTGPADGPDLLQDKKERLEHALVVEHIQTALAPLGTVDVGSTGEKIYGVLKHLHTPIRVSLEQAPSFDEIVRTLHPTAALGGWPKQPAWRWLESQDFHARRRRFGAPFGWQKGGDMACVVAIRCLQWMGAKAWLASGCGVVTGSRSDREWQELKLKRRAVVKTLGLEL